MSTYGSGGSFGTERKNPIFDDKELGHTGVERGVEEAKEESRRVVQALKKGANTVKDTVREKVAQGVEVLDRESLGESVRRAKGYVKENPGKVVLASLAVGWLAGALGRGRRNSKS
jgi:hypothetical protein